jgi:hypothetical protein
VTTLAFAIRQPPQREQVGGLEQAHAVVKGQPLVCI